MATMNKSESEQELVLGNKQLLGMFFVVVALLGVFFSMGYIIGRNTANAGSSLLSTSASAKSDTPPVERPIERTSSAPDPAPAQTTPPESTHAAEPSPTPTPAEKEPAPVVHEKKKAEVPERPLTNATLKAIPAGELYLQVAAIPLADAENERKVLRERGFPALLGESSKEGLFRVLVGPFPDMTALHISKDELKRAGFPSIVAK